MNFQPRVIAIVLVLLGVFHATPDLAVAQQTKTDNQIAYYQQLLRRHLRNANFTSDSATL